MKSKKCIDKPNFYTYFKCQLDLVFEKKSNDLEFYYKKHDSGTIANSNWCF